MHINRATAIHTASGWSLRAVVGRPAGHRALTRTGIVPVQPVRQRAVQARRGYQGAARRRTVALHRTSPYLAPQYACRACLITAGVPGPCARKFFDIHAANGSPIGAEALRRSSFCGCRWQRHGKGFDHALKRWARLIRYADSGPLSIDNNPVEKCDSPHHHRKKIACLWGRTRRAPGSFFPSLVACASLRSPAT